MAKKKHIKSGKSGREITLPIAFNIECAYDLTKNQLMCKIGDIIHIVGSDDEDVIDFADLEDEAGFDVDLSDEDDEQLDDSESDGDSEDDEDVEDAENQDHHVSRKNRKDKTCSRKKGVLSCLPTSLRR
jgi:hypothetical protein